MRSIHGLPRRAVLWDVTQRLACVCRSMHARRRSGEHGRIVRAVEATESNLSFSIAL